MARLIRATRRFFRHDKTGCRSGTEFCAPLIPTGVSGCPRVKKESQCTFLQFYKENDLLI